MFSYSYGDFAARMNNAKRNRVMHINIPNSKLNLETLELFYRIGLIRSFNLIDDNEKIRVYLKFVSGRSVFKKIKLVSLPSKRVYLSLIKLSKLRNKHSIVVFIVSTKNGLKIDTECLYYKMSGEILLKIEL
jgi:ribosomal protein S8